LDYTLFTIGRESAGSECHSLTYLLIGRESGVVRTAATFDCEMKKEYYITVVAEDGAPSDRANHYPPATPNIGIQETQPLCFAVHVFKMHEPICVIFSRLKHGVVLNT